MYILENDCLKIGINSKGAELKSLINKNDNTERFWTGNPEYWDGSSPVLFPIVGKLKNHQYNFEGKTYGMPMHGFASNEEFKIIDKGINFVTYELEWNSETYKIYPFKFKLQIKYILNNKELKVEYKVVNTDEREMYFALGAHPGFKCPIFDNETLEDYYVEFEVENETAVRKLLAPNNYFSHNTERVFESGNIMNLSLELFKNNAIIMKDIKSKYIVLKSRKNPTELKFSFDEFPVLAIWSPKTLSPFVCFEPWGSHSDYDDFNGEFREREGTITLEKGSEFNKKFTIEINK